MFVLSNSGRTIVLFKQEIRKQHGQKLHKGELVRVSGHLVDTDSTVHAKGTSNTL